MIYRWIHRLWGRPTPKSDDMERALRRSQRLIRKFGG